MTAFVISCFSVPIFCLLLYFAFLGVLANLPRFASVGMSVVAVLCWGEAVVDFARFHPYEYAYYNPLVKPQGLFELDYWGEPMILKLPNSSTTMGEGMEEGNLRWLFADHHIRLRRFSILERFEIVPSDFAAKKLIVALNRFGCIAEVTQEPLMIVKRGESVLAEFGSN